jgi:hypothetical protein
MLNGLLWTYRVVVGLMVAAVVYDFYNSQTMNLTVNLDPFIYAVVLLAALAEPAFWAFTHLCGGLLMGMAAGGIWDGLKMSFILGVGFAVARMWPYVLGGAVGVLMGGGPNLYGYGGLVLALLLFMLDQAMSWFWKHAKPDLTA